MAKQVDYRSPMPDDPPLEDSSPVFNGIVSAFAHAFVGTLLGFVGCFVLFPLLNGWPHPFAYGGLGAVLGLVRANAVSGRSGPT